MGTSASSPFEVGHQVPCCVNSKWHWKLHEGKHRGSSGPGAAVSIFRAETGGVGGAVAEMSANAFSRTKTLRHPQLLEFVNGTETDKERIVVTERVSPLVEWLGEVAEKTTAAQRVAYVAWGLYSVLQALDFLHRQNLIHGLVCPNAILVTEAGEWKLWGLDLVSDLSAGEGLAFFQKHDQLLAQLASSEFRSPERRAQDWGRVAGAASASDVWALSQVMRALDEELLPGLLSPEFSKLYKRMSANAPATRGKISQICKQAFFQHPVVRTMDFLATLAIKDHSDMLTFCRDLPAVLPGMPPRLCVCKIAPALKDVLERSSGQDRRPEDSREIVSLVIPLLSEIGKPLDDMDFQRYVQPAILPIFGMNDRAVRVQLLQRMDDFVQSMDRETINTQVFEPLLAGFADTAKVLRELTLKSMLSLAEKLSEKNLNDRLVKSLTRLQADPEPSIRTNTTIFYGRIASHLKASHRLRVILPVFFKAIKDPFPHARLAGVRAMGACKSYYEPELITSKILPSIMHLLLDPYGLVREATFTCVEALMIVVKQKSDEMGAAEEAKRAAEAAETPGGSAPPSAETGHAAAPGSGTAVESTGFQGSADGVGVAPASAGTGWDDDGDGWDDDDGGWGDSPKQTPTGAPETGGWGDDLDLDLDNDSDADDNAKKPAGASTAGRLTGPSAGAPAPQLKGMQLKSPSFGSVKKAESTSQVSSFWDEYPSDEPSPANGLSASFSNGELTAAASGDGVSTSGWDDDWDDDGAPATPAFATSSPARPAQLGNGTTGSKSPASRKTAGERRAEIQQKRAQKKTGAVKLNAAKLGPSGPSGNKDEWEEW